MEKYDVGIIGASGYVGENIKAILADHNKAEVKVELGSDMKKSDFDDLNKMDAVFLAIPHGKAKGMIDCLEDNVKIIDLTADHRLTHTYGIPEIFNKDIVGSELVANPGCYATAAILSAYPLKSKFNHAVFDCISGYSGAGKSSSIDHKKNVIAYKLTDHFHNQEMKNVLGGDISFTPHVIDVFAGIMCTSHVFFDTAKHAEEMRKGIEESFHDFYEGTFTKVVEGIPCTKEVVATPWCYIGGFEQKDNKIVIVSVIDNLMKGAASQAVENMNLMLGLDHKEGLEKYM